MLQHSAYVVSRELYSTDYNVNFVTIVVVLYVRLQNGRTSLIIHVQYDLSELC
jgi:hypothetical protein